MFTVSHSLARVIMSCDVIGQVQIRPWHVPAVVLSPCKTSASDASVYAMPLRNDGWMECGTHPLFGGCRNDLL